MMTILLRAFYHNISKVEPYCAGPENIHTPPPPLSPTEEIKNFLWGQGFSKPKTFKEMYEAKLEFSEGWGSWKKSPSWGEV